MLSVANYTPSHLLARLSGEALSNLCHHRPFFIVVFALIIVSVFVFVCVFVFLFVCFCLQRRVERADLWPLARYGKTH